MSEPLQLGPEAPPVPGRRMLWLRLAAIVGLPEGLRRRMLRRGGVAIDASTRLMPGVSFVAGNTSMGPDGYLGWGCHFDDYAPVRIGHHTTSRRDATSSPTPTGSAARNSAPAKS